MTAHEFDVIFKRYRYQLFIYASRILWDRFHSEDIVSETFVSFWQLQLSFKHEKQLSRWLYMTTKNKCINYLNKKRVESYFDLSDGETWEEISPIYEEPNMELILLQNKIVTALVKEIKLMPPKQRLITEMYLFQKIKSGKIAKELSVSRHTINAFLYLSKKRLKDTAKLLLLKNRGIYHG